jgi:hypothetical protein
MLIRATHRPALQRPDGLFVPNYASPQFSGLKAWWPYGSPLNFRDQIGNINSLPQVAQGAIVNSVGGVVSDFTGTTWQNTASAPFSVSGTTAFSISCWMQSSQSLAGPNEVHLIMTTELGTQNDATYDKGILVNTNGFAVMYAFDGAKKSASGTTNVMLGVPHLLLGTYDGTNLRIYVDGVLEGTTAASQTFAFTSPQMVFNHVPAGGVGAIATPLNYVGQAWDFRYYRWALSATDAMQMFLPNTRHDLYLQPRAGRRWVNTATATGNPWSYYAQQRRAA